MSVAVLPSYRVGTGKVHNVRSQVPCTIAGIQLWFILSYTQAVLYGQNELGLHEVSHFVPRLSWTRAWESSKESL